jgi:23S rRNA pseudouridine955/2504/2580 synthase
MPVTQLIVSVDEADTRLDRWIRRHFPGTPQSAIQKWCRTGQVRVDGGRVEAAMRLAPGQSVRVPPVPDAPKPATPPAPDPALAKELRDLVLYRDDSVIALNKPHGLPVQGGPGITRHLDALLDALRFGRDERPRLVHRLDRDTSGVLLLARSPGVAAKLAAGFRGRTIAKTYWAVVTGRPIPPEGRIDLPLRRIVHAGGQRTEAAGRDDPDAARAVTDYRTMDHAARKLAWLELQPLTGRTHQLRVHCVAMGTPILGDVKYHQPDQNDAFSAVVAGLSSELHLHARALGLPHPEGGTLLVEAGLPPHMVQTFRTVGFHAPPPRPPRREE